MASQPRELFDITHESHSNICNVMRVIRCICRNANPINLLATLEQGAVKEVITRLELY